MGLVLYFDCFAGAAGDMVLGALIDAGVSLEHLRSALGGLMLPGWRLEAEPVMRGGISATKFRVCEPHGTDESSHARPHAHHHRSVAEVCALVNGSGLSASAKRRTCELFTKLAEVEAGIHRMPVDQVHLHEVGALDSIIDIAGTVVAMECLGADTVVASSLNVGSGTVRTAHGMLPVPAPATAALLAGVPVFSSGAEGELVTPTGALLIAGYATAFGPVPPMTLVRVGYGAGDRDIAGTPNVVRVLVGTTAAREASERVTVIETEIDDMSPQIFGLLMDRLYAAGALEVFYTAVQMKKNRPGTLVTVLARPEQREALSTVLFRETTTIGLRYQEIDRVCLEREIVTVSTPLGPVRFKIGRRGGEVVNVAPEFDDCARLAVEGGIPAKEVQAIAVRAYWEQQSS